MSNLFDWLHKAEHTESQREAEPEGVRGAVIAALRTIYDPEIPVNIYELGLVYELDVDEAARKAHIKMTLTAPGCPVAQTFPETVQRAVETVEGIDEAEVELVWDPPWSPARMSEAARLELGMFGDG